MTIRLYRRCVELDGTPLDWPESLRLGLALIAAALRSLACRTSAGRTVAPDDPLRYRDLSPMRHP